MGTGIQTVDRQPPAKPPAGGARMPLALALGVVKGGALGVGAAAAVGQGWMAPGNGLLPILLGVAIGVVAGRPFWRPGAWAATLLKAIFGGLAGWGAAWGVAKLGLLGQPWIWLPLFGVLWALLLEVDDAVGNADDAPAKPKTPEK